MKPKVFWNKKLHSYAKEELNQRMTILEIEGVKKRYFSVESMKNFEILLLNDEGTTYKDSRIGVNNLIQFIGKKS